MRRGLKNLARTVDQGLSRLGRRRILIDIRTPVYAAVLGPVYRSLASAGDVRLTVTSEHPGRIAPVVDGLRVISHAQAEWRRFDVYMNADPWAAPRLRRTRARINFFHGVAGKYDLDRPTGLPMGFEQYDLVAFINHDRMARYLDAGIVTAEQARLVGYPKLDALASGRVDRAAARARFGLDPARPTVLYAPTYSPASSLHRAGESIVAGLAGSGHNVLVKLHDRSLDPDPRYTAGIDWRARMRALERPGRVRFVEDADASPCLAAADAMVTDHSSVGFEYLVLDRPLIVIDAPGLVEAARINPEKVALLRSAATVVAGAGALPAAVRAELADPARQSDQRRQVASQMFHDAGRATERAVSLVRDLLHQTPVTRADAAAVSPGRSVS